MVLIGVFKSEALVGVSRAVRTNLAVRAGVSRGHLKDNTRNEVSDPLHAAGPQSTFLALES
jgi:hypothetical protein